MYVCTSMYVSMYVRVIYVCMYVRVFMYEYVCMYVCMQGCPSEQLRFPKSIVLNFTLQFVLQSVKTIQV